MRVFFCQIKLLFFLEVEKKKGKKMERQKLETAASLKASVRVMQIVNEGNTHVRYFSFFFHEITVHFG